MNPFVIYSKFSLFMAAYFFNSFIKHMRKVLITSRWNGLLVECMSRIGRNLLDSRNWAQHLRDAGFVDVTEHRVLVPVSPWARGKKNKLLGAISQQNLLEGVASMSTAAFTRILGWTKENLDIFLARVREDLKNKDVHAYGTVYFVHGKKPL
jgi:hypothetical protein